MPLLKGKQYVGRNIEELTASGRPRAQAIAIALKTAGVSTKLNDKNMADSMSSVDEKNKGGSMNDKGSVKWPGFFKR